MNRLLLFLFLVLMAHSAMGQDATKDSLVNAIERAQNDSLKLQTMFELAKHVGQTDLNESIAIYTQANELAEISGDELAVAKSLKSIGNNYYFQSDYVNALIYWEDAKTVFEKIDNRNGVANVLGNMAAIYYNQSEYVMALELNLQALTIAEEEQDSLRIGTVLQNIGAIHIDKGDRDRGIEVYQRVLVLFDSLNYDQGYAVACVNMGGLYIGEDIELSIDYYQKALEKVDHSSSYYVTVLIALGQTKLETSGFDEAFEYLDSAYHIASRVGDEYEITNAALSMAAAYVQKGDPSTAQKYYQEVQTKLLKADQWNRDLVLSTSGLVKLYANKKDYANAFANQEILIEARSRIYGIETDQKIDRLLFTHDLEKKEVEIALLVKDQELQKLEVEKQKGIRNGFVIGFLIILVFAGFALFQRNQIRKGKKLSDELLLNILPEEVAAELKEKGHSDAQLIDHVTVLFTDFKGFTAMSEKLSPKNLVKDLHACFSEFDRICEKYGIEKIKTIGDSYMAAGGLPSPSKTHVQDIINVALEMTDVVMNGKADKIAQNLPFFEIRVGVHTGPVVAGIVGIKKFQYDIWGDTVNTASRIESSSEVGKVNISKATYELLKDDPSFQFENRGKIQAKGKGEMEMWFVSRNKI